MRPNTTAPSNWPRRRVPHPLQPATIASWRAWGRKILDQSARAVAGDSALTGTRHALLEAVAGSPSWFSSHGQPGVAVGRAGSMRWSPVWQIDGFGLAGATSQLSFKGKGRRRRFIEAGATSFDSAWLQDWIAVAGPHWQVHTLQVHGQDVQGVLDFDTTLTGQIAMEPRPAEVHAARGERRQWNSTEELTVVESTANTRATEPGCPSPGSCFTTCNFHLMKPPRSNFSMVTEPDYTLGPPCRPTPV